MNSFKQIPLLASLLSLTLVTGCETKEDNQIAKAQNCLDQATQSTASSCSGMVSGLESQAAYKIRCAAGFLSEGFTTSKFADAFNKLANKETANASIAAVANMAMSSVSKATEIYSNCDKAGSAGMKNLAVLAKTSTTLLNATGSLSTVAGYLADGTITDAELNALQSNINPATMSTADKQALGQSVVDLSSAYCSSGGSYSSTQMCSDVNNAISAANGDLTQLATEFANRIKAN